MKMHRLSLLVVLGLISLSGFSQYHQIGIKSGMNKSFVEFVDSLYFNDPKMHTGFSAGVTYEYLTASKFSFGADLVYQEKGFDDLWHFRDETGASLADIRKEFEYNYITLPLSVGYSLGSKMIGFVKFGVTPSYLVRAREIMPGFDEYRANTKDLTSKTTRFDFGCQFELGAEYRFLEKYSVFVSSALFGSYTRMKTYVFYFSEVKHFGFNVSAGLKYRL